MLAVKAAMEKEDKKEFVFRLALMSLWDGCRWQM